MLIPTSAAFQRFRSTSYCSLCQATAQGEFVEIMVKLCNFKRGQGSLVEFAFKPALTDLIPADFRRQHSTVIAMIMDPGHAPGFYFPDGESLAD